MACYSNRLVSVTWLTLFRTQIANLNDKANTVSDVLCTYPIPTRNVASLVLFVRLIVQADTLLSELCEYIVQESQHRSINAVVELIHTAFLPQRPACCQDIFLL